VVPLDRDPVALGVRDDQDGPVFREVRRVLQEVDAGPVSSMMRIPSPSSRRTAAQEAAMSSISSSSHTARDRK
jgi:hypothetical protein